MRTIPGTRNNLATLTLAMGFLLAGFSESARTAVHEYGTPTVDLSKNPGCGVKGLSPEEKTKRNIRIAEYWFAAYVEAGMGTEMKHTLDEWDCMADDAT